MKEKKPIDVDNKYYVTETRKKYINQRNQKYAGGAFIINRSIACAKTTREGCTRADTTDYICKELMENENIENKDMTKYRIRKLTPKECWRLMGFDDEDYDKAAKVCSESMLYKQAGNSIVVQVLEAIIGNLYND